MAYTQQRSSFGASTNKPGSSNAMGSAKKTGTATTKREVLFTTGLFAPNKEGVKAIGSVQLKEDLNIPAGSYVNLYAADEIVEGKPVYRIQMTPGVLKSAK